MKAHKHKKPSPCLENFALKKKKLSQNECCTVTDYLFVINERGNSHDSDVYVNMLMSEHGKRQYKDTYWMKYVR